VTETMHGQAMLNAHNHDQSYATASQSQSHPYLLSPVLFLYHPYITHFYSENFYLLVIIIVVITVFI